MLDSLVERPTVGTPGDRPELGPRSGCQLAGRTNPATTAFTRSITSKGATPYEMTLG